MLALILAILLVGITYNVWSQTEEPKAQRPVKVSLLGGYYEQEGEHGAVDGGQGSQELYSNTAETAIYIPVKDSSAIRVGGGFDYYTSASLLRIDKYQTAASSGTSNVSGDELRTYFNLGYDFAGKKNFMLMPTVGYSKEYDVTSYSAGFAFSKNLKKRNGNFTAGINFIADEWLLIYPGEFRSQAVYTTGASSTYSTAASNSSGDSGSSGIFKPFGHSTAYEKGSGSSGDDDHDSSGSSGSGTDGSGTEGSGTTGSGTTTGSGSTSGTETSGETSSGSATASDSTYYSAAPIIPVTGKTSEKDGKTYPVDWRYTTSFNAVYTFAINKRSNMAIGTDLGYQQGMLSTPFYRVYFNDGVTNDFSKEVRIEKLPSLRLKAAIFARYNITLNKYLRVRTFARVYTDDWGISAVTASVEAPIKLSSWFTAGPFYRFHVQQGSRYFAGYSEHVFQAGSYYTSDYDLSSFHASAVGGTLRIAPLAGIASIQNKATRKSIFSFKSAGLRYAYYMRSDGLNSKSVTVELSFEI